MSRALDRRTFLRGLLTTGVAASVPLPRLGCMLNESGTAYASGAPLPQRFGTWFFGNGIVPSKWVPDGQGHGNAWSLSPQLQPLAHLKPYLSVASGYELKTESGISHAAGPAGALTGAIHDETKTVQLPSIDQVVADLIGGDTPYRSLEVGVSQAAPFDTGTVFYSISHTGPDAPRYPEFDPRALYDRLFGISGATPAARERGRSVLDAVLGDFASLKQAVGASDKARLDQHAEGIRAVERRLDGFQLACGVPGDPRLTHPNVVLDREEQAPPELNDLMAELLATAIGCDLTRVFSFMFTYPAAQVYFRHLGAKFDKAFHDHVVHESDEHDTRGLITEGVQYTMGCLAALLDRLAAMPEGDGTVLDNSLIYATSCSGRGWDHDPYEFPLLLAGRAGGAIRGNTHVRSSGRANVSEMLYTIANVHGANVLAYGKGDGRVTRGIDGLLT